MSEESNIEEMLANLRTSKESFSILEKFPDYYVQIADELIKILGDDQHWEWVHANLVERHVDIDNDDKAINDKFYKAFEAEQGVYIDFLHKIGLTIENIPTLVKNMHKDLFVNETVGIDNLVKKIDQDAYTKLLAKLLKKTTNPEILKGIIRLLTIHGKENVVVLDEL